MTPYILDFKYQKTLAEINFNSLTGINFNRQPMGSIDYLNVFKEAIF